MLFPPTTGCNAAASCYLPCGQAYLSYRKEATAGKAAVALLLFRVRALHAVLRQHDWQCILQALCQLHDPSHICVSSILPLGALLGFLECSVFQQHCSLGTQCNVILLSVLVLLCLQHI
jgi:hypothetical protein